jgi:hypothetical protein
MNEQTACSGKARGEASDFRQDTGNQENRTRDNPSDQTRETSPFNEA